MNVIGTALLSVGLYMLATAAMRRKAKPYPTLAAMKAMNRRGLYERAIHALSRAFEPFVKVDARLEGSLRKDLARAGINLTPKRYICMAAAKASVHLLLALASVVAGVTVAAVALIFLGATVYLKERYRVREALRRKDEAILEEMPGFIRSFGYSLEAEGDIIRIFERYRAICGEDFKYDLDRLITDLKTGNMEDALSQFDERVNLPQMSGFVSGIIGITKGVDQRTFFFIMESEMKALSRENVRRALARRPGKVRRATVAVGACMFLLYLVPMGMQLFEGLRLFG